MWHTSDWEAQPQVELGQTEAVDMEEFQIEEDFG